MISRDCFDRSLPLETNPSSAPGMESGSQKTRESPLNCYHRLHPWKSFFSDGTPLLRLQKWVRVVCCTAQPANQVKGCKRREIMVLLEKLWDDVLAGPQPERGLGRLRKMATPLNVKDLDGGEGSSKYQRSLSMPGAPGTPVTPTTPVSPNSPNVARKENVWRSVFHPGSNLATKTIGANVFDKPQPNSPTVYDWLYSGETRSKHR